MSVLYSHLKFLLYPEHLQAIREKKIVAPIHIRIKPINHCNHNCWYCAYRYDNLQLGDAIDLKDRIPEAKMQEITEDIISMGVKAVTFSGGGEPLLYKPLPEVITRLAEAGVRVASLTNGSNLMGKMADAFARHGTWVRVSLDGWDDASYSKARGVASGSFTRLINNMREFKQRKSRCVLGVSFIIGKENHRHVLEVVKLLKDVGVNHVKLTGVVTANEGGVNDQYHQEIKTEVAKQIAAAKELASADFAVLDHYHDLGELFAKGYNFCPFLQFLTVIGADCKVYACQDKAYTESGLLGDISGQSFKEFWFSAANHARLYGLNPSLECQHHCVTHMKNLAVLEALSLDLEHAVFV